MSIGLAGVFMRQSKKTLIASTIEHLCIVAIPRLFVMHQCTCTGLIHQYLDNISKVVFRNAGW